MTDLSLVDPDLRAILEMVPPIVVTPDVLPTVRAQSAAAIAMAPWPEDLPKGREQWVPGPDGDPDVRVLVHSPKSPTTNARPAILHIHGGGYVMGTPEMSAAGNAEAAELLDAVIVSVDYRLSPETPYPGALHDCYAVLKWMNETHGDLGIDRNQIAVWGQSAGGGIAAGLALLVRDRGEFTLAFQHLVYPMIDDRTCVSSDPHPHVGAHVWNADSNRIGWQSYLGQEPGSASVPPYAAAARADNLAGLPPAYISVGTLDLFLEENLDYARRLTRAGVPVELHVYPGAYHGFEMTPSAGVTLKAKRDSLDALKKWIEQSRSGVA